MKGVVLAGGLGTRMYPLTKVTNKHLLPVYDQPMIYYPIQTLVEAGIDEVLIVTGGNNSGDFLRLLGNGKDFGLKSLTYAYQEGEGGIAAALSLAECFVDGGRVIVMLGDNIFERSIKNAVDKFMKQDCGAHVLLKEVHDPERFGVAVFDDQRQLICIDEKPLNPASNFAVTGAYMYDKMVFEFIKTMKPSKRGELEISDVNNFYISAGNMGYSMVDGWWTDAGTFDSLMKAGSMVGLTRPSRRRQ